MNSEKYIGLDVHQATISVVMDSQGKVAGNPSWKPKPLPFWSSSRDCAAACP